MIFSRSFDRQENLLAKFFLHVDHVIVIASPVSTFDDEVVAFGKGRGVLQDRHVRPAQVATETQTNGLFIAIGDLNFHNGRSENVSGVGEPRLNPIADVESVIIGVGNE